MVKARNSKKMAITSYPRPSGPAMMFRKWGNRQYVAEEATGQQHTASCNKYTCNLGRLGHTSSGALETRFYRIARVFTENGSEPHSFRCSRSRRCHGSRPGFTALAQMFEGAVTMKHSEITISGRLRVSIGSALYFESAETGRTPLRSCLRVVGAAQALEDRCQTNDLWLAPRNALL